MKVELLSPVGNMESLYQAVHNGADAVYLGGKSFGARKYANNFTNDELVEAINYAHIYGVKVYVTANTIIYNDEVEEFVNYLTFLHKNNVDAVIMQDIGMISLIRKVLPNLEVHASTQCHNHNTYGIKCFKDLGVTRVVFDREMSLSEINNINIDIEKEVFIHGALCISYSGCCLFSSLNGGRSGNRGECVGSCRLPYKLLENDKVIDTKGEYLLSTKELNTLDNLKEILDSGITSLKIEGRMKSPEYVGFITKLYRTLIDKYYNKEEMILTKEDIDNLKVLFNRKFTKGFLFNDNIINIESPNHQGINLGKVVKTTKNRIYIKLSRVLNQEDGIRFKESNTGMIVNMLYDKHDKLVNKGNPNDIISIPNKVNLKADDTVLKTIDKDLLKKLNNYGEKKIKVDYKVTAKINKELYISLSDGINEVEVRGTVVEPSINNPVTKEVIIDKLSKLGNTPFILNNIEVDIDDNIFISLKELNELRRDLVTKLINKRIENKKEIIINEIPKIKDNVKTNNVSVNVLVRNEEQLLACLNKVDNIYTDDYNLYLKYKSNNIYYRTSRVMSSFNEFKNENILASELGSAYKYSKNNNVVSDYFLNVVNDYSIKFFKELGVKRVVISPECDFNKIKLLKDKDIEVIIYGKMELMIMKYCPLKELLNNCSVCKTNKNKYYLQDRLGYKYRIIHNNCLTHIMHYKNIDYINNIKDYIDMGIKNYRIELLDETQIEIQKLLEKIPKYY